MKIGYVGLGAMGGALSHWLVKKHHVLGWDLNSEVIEQFVSHGGQAAGSLAQLARDSDVIFLCLPRSRNVEDALFGDAGLAEGLSAGKIVVDQTSGIAAETHAMAQRLEAMGVTMLDAPVAGGVPAATAGTITIMVSGADAAQKQVLPAFEAMTSKIYRAGNQTGDAQSVKTLNNMMNMVFRVATLELAAVAVKMGVPLPVLADVLKNGRAGNFTCRTVLPAIIEGRSTGDFALTLMLKDNNQALELGMADEIPMPMSALARGVLQQNINLTGPSANLDDVISFMAQVTGVDFNDTQKGEGGDDKIIGLVETALAASNRAIAYEILSVAAKKGMALSDFGEIVNNGSAWSRECEVILAELDGSAPKPTQTLGDVVRALQEIERINVTKGVAIVMLGEVRAIYETALKTFGPDASVDVLARPIVRSN